MKTNITIDGSSLTIEDVYEVALNSKEVKLSNDKEFLKDLSESRNFLESYIEKGYPIYGVTTGFGDSCHNQIGPKKTEKLQNYLVDFHGIGIGDAFSEEESRAITLVRLNSNIKGFSAIRPELAELMENLLNHGISPFIPQLRSPEAPTEPN